MYYVGMSTALVVLANEFSPNWPPTNVNNGFSPNWPPANVNNGFAPNWPPSN